MQIIIIATTFYGAVRTSDLAWVLGDIGLGLMVWVNIIALLFLVKPSIIALKDYEEQKKQGIDPQFDPVKLGIKNADFWEQKIKKEK